MSYEIVPLTKPVQLGEGPHWDAEQKCLYYVSILDCTIHKYDPATKSEASAKLSGRTSFIIPIAGSSDKFVTSVEREVLIIRWDGKSDKVEIVKKLAEVDENKTTNRLNEGKVDPMGRLFAGTMGKEIPPDKFEVHQGTLYSFDESGSHECSGVDKISLSGGLAWDKSRSIMYFVDTIECNIRAYDFDMRTGVMSNQRIVFRLKEKNVKILPAGMAIDAEGFLWVALFEGYRVVKVDPATQEIVETINMPIAEVTSVAFGGEKLDELYVTSSKTQEKKLENSGAVFRVTGPGLKGYAGESFKLKI